jgi:hypothetical protein
MRQILATAAPGTETKTDPLTPPSEYTTNRTSHLAITRYRLAHATDLVLRLGLHASVLVLLPIDTEA